MLARLNHARSRALLRRFAMNKCSEVMTRNPVSCVPDDSVVRVAQLMKAEDIGPVPIVENRQTRKLIGMVTDRDLAMKMVAESRDPNTTRVEEVMSRQIVTCHADDDIQKALDAMAENQLRRIPVVDGDGAIIGIISQADVATRVNQPEKTATVVRRISRSTADDREPNAASMPKLMAAHNNSGA
jgi:CBS domain-containing protein